MGLVVWIVMGGLAGWIADVIMKNHRSMRTLANIMTGIVGAFFGGLVVSLILRLSVYKIYLSGILGALAGCAVLLTAVYFFRNSRKS